MEIKKLLTYLLTISQFVIFLRRIIAKRHDDCFTDFNVVWVSSKNINLDDDTSDLRSSSNKYALYLLNAKNFGTELS